MNPHGGNWLTTALPFVALALVVAWRFRSMSKERPLNIGTLWVVPAIYVALMASLIVALPPHAAGWAVMAAGLVAGAVLGWHRGKLIRIERNAQTGQLMQRASPLAMVLLLILIALKFGMREVVGDSAAAHPSSAAMLVTDAFIGFALGLLSATRLELYLRARSILENG